MSDFTFWTEALAGNPVNIYADAPQCGYYKMRRERGGPWLPVAIWSKDGSLVCRVSGEMVDPVAVWTFCAENPVTKEDCKVAFQTGNWPGDVTIGHNSGDLSLAEEIQIAAENAAEFLMQPIGDGTRKDMAANMRDLLLELAKKADAERDAEKRPHDEAAKAIQKKWKPLIDAAEDAALKLRDALTRYMREEDRRAEEERRKKFEEETARVKAERERIEREQAEMMQRDPIAALTSPQPDLPEMPILPTEPVKIQAGGQRGRKTGLRTVIRYEVTDHAAALAFFAEHDDVKTLVATLAKRAGKAGLAVPGVTRIEDKVAA